MRATRKTQQKRRNRRKQASRGLNQAPKRLAELLALIDMVPPHTELPDLVAVWWKYKKEAEPSSDEKYYILMNAAAEEIKKSIADMPEDFREYVWPKDAQEAIEALGIEEYIDLAVADYTSVREARENLRAIIRIFKDVKPGQFTSSYLGPLDIPTFISLDDQGLISIIQAKFINAIDGVEAARIRECEICKRIFWAGRKTQQACSPACAHALRNRRYRARYKDYLIRQHMKENATEQKASSSSRKSKSKKK